MPKILWIADVEGWAYDNRAKALSLALPGYEHAIVYDIVKRFDEALPHLSTADLIVCPDPRVLCFLPGRANVVQHLNALKIF